MGNTVNTTVERIVLETLDKNSEASVKRVTGALSDMRAGIDTVQGALAAVGVTIGVGAMLALAKDTLSAVAALDDMAESTGASVEMLSAIQRVAKVGGHDFDGLTAQIGKTVKGLRESSEEGGRAARALDFLGVKAKDDSGRFRDMGEVMVEVARALDKYQDGGNKVALVQDVLGKGAERYIPLLKDIAEGTDLVVTTTARQAEEADKAEKAMRRVGVAMEDNRRLLVNQYSPALTDLLEQMSTGIRLFGGFGSALYNIGFGIDPFKSMAENIRELNEEIARAETESPYAAARRGSALGGPDVETLRKRKEFLLFQQRQQSNRLIDDSNMDARDLRLRGIQRGPLDYNSPSEGGDSKVLREVEFRAQKQVELEEMAAADSREAWDFYTKGRLTQEADLRKGQEQMMKDWFALIDQEQTDAYARGQEYLDSESNRQQEFYNEQLNTLIRAREDGLLTEEEFRERALDAEIRHQERITGVTNTAYQQRQRFIRSSMMVQAQTIFGELENITAGVAQHNKILFRINQVAGIANAIISAHQGASKSLAAYPWPLAGIMAAIHYAAGIARVAAIAGTSFEGGGAGSAPSVAGSAPAQPVTPISQAPALQTQQRPQQEVKIYVNGRMARGVLEEVAEGLNDLAKDGFPVLFAVQSQ